MKENADGLIALLMFIGLVPFTIWAVRLGDAPDIFMPRSSKKRGRH